MNQSPSAILSWPELVTTALLGTDRRPLPGPDAAATLLAQAALRAVERRAGLCPGPAAPRPPLAPEDHREPLPDGARRRLAMLLPDRGSAASGGVASGGAVGGAGNLANINELLPQWLAAAHRQGYRVPADLVPPLLDAARARSELRADAVALAGPLGHWLAERNPDWRYALRTPLDSDSAEADPVLWAEGLFAERVTQLTRLRRQDPDAARELLRATWSAERAEDRLLFLDALQERLSLADEPFLESALNDRSKNVRLTAAELLSTLPGSALAQRMAQRARAAVRLVGTADGPRLSVHPPTGCDAAAQRDGIAATSPTGRAERAFWLGEIIAATPLELWATDFGPPDAVLALPVSDNWRSELREGWTRAATRQNDAGWARALLGAPDAAAETPGAGAAKLLTVLPPDERAEWTAGFVDTHGLVWAFQLLVACPAPWTAPLGDAVLRALAGAARSGGSYPWNYNGVLGVAERALAPHAAPELDRLAADADSAWAEMFTRLAATLRLRATMFEELGR
ncbi:DUF5691 domain-containing protein [Streptacidiphilus sp. EB129]|uniref:DUF5691 domain-containing protein n=1 Tax=Streptacidiphilus sp. EB129 TaxID=3156262 RepID=UPI00351827B6